MMIGAFRKFVAAKVAGHVDVHTVDVFVTDLVPVHGLRKTSLRTRALIFTA